MPAAALCKGLLTRAAWLPAASLERSVARSTTAPRCLTTTTTRCTPGWGADRGSAEGAGTAHPRWLTHHCGSLGGRQPVRQWCSSDGGGGGAESATQDLGGLPADSKSGSQWRLEEGGTETHSALNVVLVSPQIPGNAGSIARTCAAAGVRLHLVEPMAFQLDDAKLKRAGLDYWPYVCVAVHSSWDAFMDYFHNQSGPKRLIGFSKKAQRLYTEVSYAESDWLLFGSETSGFPEATVAAVHQEGALVRIPMSERHVRSLNLSVSVGIGLFEALRQLEAAAPHAAYAKGHHPQQATGGGGE